MNELQDRLDYLRDRLHTAYDSLGHSSGRPYVYFVYPPEQERTLRRLADETLRSDPQLCFQQIDLLPLTIESLKGQEERRQQLLNDPDKTASVTDSILRIWARAVSQAILTRLEAAISPGRPVVVLCGLAALHPLGDPTRLMEALAEQEPRDPRTNSMVPIILLVPGVRPPQTSRRYLFLGVERLRQDFYRGEEA